MEYDEDEDEDEDKMCLYTTQGLIDVIHKLERYPPCTNRIILHRRHR